MNTLIIEQCYSLCEWECVPTLSDTVDRAKEPYWNGNTVLSRGIHTSPGKPKKRHNVFYGDQ